MLYNIFKTSFYLKTIKHENTVKERATKVS